MTALGSVFLGGALVSMSPIGTESVAGLAVLTHLAKEGGRELFVDGTGECPREAKRCFGIALHVVEVEGKPVAPPLWVYQHVETANRLFAPISVGFEVVSVEAEAAELAHMDTRKDRDLLGREDFNRGVVHVYVVAQLDDVDIEGEQIRGVHWRDRADTSRRWIILSAIGSRMVLAHELGHFFGLPHSKYQVSIMNKTPRPKPKWRDRVFAKPEVEKMKRHRDAMLADGMLIDRNRKRRR